MTQAETKTATLDATRPQPITPEAAVYDIKAAGSPRISPDGARIVYSVGQTDRDTGKGTSQLWLCDPDGGNRQQITWTGRQNSDPNWSPDGTSIAFVSDRGEGPGQGVYLLPVGGGEARELTRHAQGIIGLAWSPDSGTIAYTTAVDPDNPDETPRDPDAPPPVRVVRRIDYKQDNRGYLNDVRQQVFLVDVASGERRQLTRELVDHSFPQWSPEGRRIAVKIPNRNGMQSQLGLIDVATGAVQRVGPEGGVVGTWAWSPDGSFILFDGDTANTAQTDYFRFDVAGGEVTRLTDDLAVLPVSGFPTISPPDQPVWLDERRALVHAMRAGASGLYTVDSQSGEVAEVQRWEATQAGLSLDREQRLLVQGRSDLDGTGELVVFDRLSGETTVITDLNAAFFAEHPAARWEKLAITREGVEIDAWLLSPPDLDPARTYPVILDVHGGPHSAYGYAFNNTAQILATNGFLVVAANPRGSGTYGREFADMVRGDWGGEDYLDLLAVLDHVLERPEADAARTGIYGYSYGGYMTAWTIG
jgi:dipeptidyl aminopeptidase/acylaminoacyl peptidase